jgi:hypothetical protein
MYYPHTADALGNMGFSQTRNRMSETWLEFRVTEPCLHAQDIYEDCPLCTIETLQARIDELSIEHPPVTMRKLLIQEQDKNKRLDAALTAFIEDVEGAIGCTDGDDIRNHIEPAITEARKAREFKS